MTNIKLTNRLMVHWRDNDSLINGWWIRWMHKCINRQTHGWINKTTYKSLRFILLDPKSKGRLQLRRNSQVSLSLSSGVGAMSTALLLWQFRSVGSAPWLSSREHTSTLFLDAASCRGVNCHRSMAFTQAPCCRRKSLSEHFTNISSFKQLFPNKVCLG